VPAQYTRADSLREYLTGASSDGGSQSNPLLSLGNYRSATEALSLGITIINPITGVIVQYAGGANPIGNGILTAIDTSHLTWQPSTATSPGAPAGFTGSADTEIVEADGSPGQYLRITGTTPFSIGVSTVSLSYLADNVFGFDDITIANAASGLNEYRATMIRNEGTGSISSFQRWIATLGTSQTSNIAVLSSSGSGIISTSGSFATWPASGWCQIQTSTGTLKEVVYYTARTLTSLTVSTRGMLGTTATSGAITDSIFPCPGVSIAVDPTGVQSFGADIQSVANANTAPTGVTWNLGLTQSSGLQIGTLAVDQQVGIWMWRQIPPGAVSTPQAVTRLLDSFNAF
jgi:hypothetical protein